MAETQRWLTTEEAARLTGYNVEYIRRLVRTKKVEARKWGREWMVSRSALLNYQDNDDRPRAQN